MSKVKIIDKKSEESILNEKNILSKIKHPFIINMYCAFQDYENLYLLLDLLSGGDLRYQFNSLENNFGENEVKFFISCIILSLEYIHSQNIIHRDIKPENLVFDSKGYLRLTDFGVAKILKPENTTISDTSGTPGYMAPEVLFTKNHTFHVDIFAIGVIGYELLIGHRPYRGKDRKEIRKNMKEKQIMIEADDNKGNKWSDDCINFINRCLKKNPEMRIGYHFGIKELKVHKWFDKYDWNKLYNKNIEPIFKPKNEKNFDKMYCENSDKIYNDTFERYKGYMHQDNYIKIFEGYTFFNNEVTINTLENESITRVSTSNKVNQQEILENNNSNNHGNIFLGPINSNHNSNIKKNDKLLIEKKILDNIKKIQNKEASLFNALLKEQKNKKIWNKKQENNDKIKIININIINNPENKNKDENIYNNNNKITENDSKSNINKEKEKDKNEINSNNNISSIIINKNTNMNIYNNLDSLGVKMKIYRNNSNEKVNDYILKKELINNNEINKNNIISNDINSDIKINNDINLNKFNKNNSIIINDNSKISIPKINLTKFQKKQLNIHNLSCLETKEKYKESNTSKNNNNHLQIFNYFISRKYNYNRSPNNKNNSFILPNIRHFNFKISNKKKIRHINLNRNKIIENNNTNNPSNTNNANAENRHSKILDRFLYRYPQTNQIIKSEQDNNNKKLGKSQSSIFPLIKVA